MSTDIGALQKQYAKLRRKQHHACVVMSGIRPGRADTDVHVDTDSPGSPTPVGISGSDDQVEGSVAMLTLSVPIETEKHHQDLIDPVSPSVFGETKCFFVQNVKKKKAKGSKHSNRSVKSAVPDPDGKITSDSTESIGTGAVNKAYHTETAEDHTNRKDKRVCFSEKVEIVSGLELKNPLKENSLKDGNAVHQNGIVVQKVELNNDVKVKQEKDNHSANEKDNGELNEMSNNDATDASEERKKNECSANANSLESIDGDEERGAALGTENNEESLNNQIQNSNNNDISDAHPVSASKEHHSSILKNARTQGLGNPAVKFSKQYYPSGQVSHKKLRTNSDSAESTNKQSIYQHFMMTKRQLSLDSAMSVEHNQATPTKSIEYPFPVHSINEHKIKAGMKLGLYDQRALEKFEKTKKLPKSKLPNLTFD